jgi:menaquinone-9 beta-reductase
MPTLRETVHAVVVGGGPAGSATAWALASQGLDVLVLDRARFPRDKPCAEYLSPQGSRILDAMGVLGTVEAAGAAQLAGMRVRSPDGGMIHGEFAAQHGFTGFRDRGLALRRRVLDPILQRAAQSAGACVRDNQCVDALITVGDTVTGVRVRSAKGAREIRAALVIGADGLRSGVARNLGLASRLPWPRRVAFVAHYRGVPGIGAHGEMHVERDGYAGLADVGHGETTEIDRTGCSGRQRRLHDTLAAAAPTTRRAICVGRPKQRRHGHRTIRLARPPRVCAWRSPGG